MQVFPMYLKQIDEVAFYCFPNQSHLSYLSFLYLYLKRKIFQMVNIAFMVSVEVETTSFGECDTVELSDAAGASHFDNSGSKPEKCRPLGAFAATLH